MKYIVLGAYQNAGKEGQANYCEDRIGVFDTPEKAEEFARSQKDAWDDVIIEEREE